MASGWQSEASLAALKEQRRRQREELLAEVGGPAPAGSLQPLGPGLGAGGGAGGSPWGAGAGQVRAGAGRRVISGGLCWAVEPGLCLLYARAWEEANRPHRGVCGAVAVSWLGWCCCLSPLLKAGGTEGVLGTCRCLPEPTGSCS